MASRYEDDDFRDMVKTILSEARESAKDVVLREYGDEFGDAFGDTGWADFKKVMGDPGKVKDAAIGSVLKTSVKAQTLLRTLYAGLPSLVIPFIKTNYEKIYSNEQNKLNQIRQRYPDVFKNASELFTDDAKMVAFMVNPVLMTSAAAAKGATNTVMNLTQALAADNASVVDWLKKIWKKTGDQPLGFVKRAVVGKDSTDFAEALDRLIETPQKSVLSVLQSKEFQDKLSQTSIVQGIKERSEDVLNETLNAIIDLAESVTSAKSLDDLDPTLTNGLKRMTQGLSKEELQEADDQILRQIKAAVIKTLTARVQMHLKEFESVNIPESSDLIRVFQKVAERIQSLASS